MNKNPGFTLIELLVVVLIIGILSSVALPQYAKAVGKARTTEALSNLRSLAQAAELYALEMGEWPESFDSLSVVPSGELSSHSKPNDKVEGKNYNYTLIDGRIDAGTKDGTSYPSFLYVSKYANRMQGQSGKHFYCYYVTKNTASDKKMEQMCKAMGGGEEYKPNSGSSVWFALD